MVGITYPSSATNTFGYNGLGLRVSKSDSSGALAYVCDGTRVASAVLKDGASVYTPGLSERRGTASKFLHSDALGTTRGVTDSTQAAADSLLFDAFGQVVSRTGTTPTPFGFVGASQYQTDKDSGLLLLGHRYYDPSIGRFLSQDPIQDGDNWYKYADNNPLTKIDPKGQFAWLLVAAVCIIVIAVTNGDGRHSQPPPPPTPSAPPDVDIDKNAEQAAHHSWTWFRDQVKTGGPWDFKNGHYDNPGQYENYGNYHFGYTGKAAGFPDYVLETGAGIAQIGDKDKHPNDPNYSVGIPGIIPSYGDDPKDNYWIQRGMDDWRRNAARDGSGIWNSSHLPY